MDELHNELREKVEATIAAGLTEEATKKIAKVASDLASTIEDDILYRLKDELASHLACFTAEMAEKTVTALLEGREEQAREYLMCRQGYWNGRSDGDTMFKRDISKRHPIIHGALFEQGAVKLRRDIVNAHRDLLVNERIKDLEDQNASVVAQYNKLKHEMDERYRAA